MVGWSVGGWVGRISRPPIEPAAGLGQAPSLPPAACPVPSEGSQPRAKVWGFGREPAPLPCLVLPVLSSIGNKTLTVVTSALVSASARLLISPETHTLVPPSEGVCSGHWNPRIQSALLVQLAAVSPRASLSVDGYSMAIGSCRLNQLFPSAHPQGLLN